MLIKQEGRWGGGQEGLEGDLGRDRRNGGEKLLQGQKRVKILKEETGLNQKQGQ